MNQKIAIIGSGISGLASAYLLNDRYDVHLFEANNYVGGHTCTVDVHEKDQNIPIDVGFIVFNDKTYPQFTKLLEKENIKSQKTQMSFSYESFDKSICYNGHTLSTMLACPNVRYSLKFYLFIYEILRFNRLAKQKLKNGISQEETVDDFVKKHRFSDFFVESYIIPIAASVWSSDQHQILKFPLTFLFGFLDNHGLFNLINRPQWYVIKGGSKTYTKALTKNLTNKVYLNTPIRSISRNDQGVILKTDSGSIGFDKVILATHSDQALSLLNDPSEKEINILSAIPYQKNEIILHTDSAILPRIKKCWASWNFHGNQDNRCTLTYYMNRLQSFRAEKDYCVSVNLAHKISEAKVIRKFEFHHPLYAKQTIAAQQRINEINGKQNTFFCGAYWGYGFHEDGVVSAINVCNLIGSLC